MRFILYLIVVSLLCSCSLGNDDEYSSPQTLYVKEDTHHWWDDTVFYQVFLRSFRDADGDGHGDFNGVVEKLDYLKELNVGGIWLTPMFESPSYHGYDVLDFYKIDAAYGTMAEFENMVEKAHSKGIRVLLDVVINHVSDQHSWFIKSAKREVGYEDFFVWRNEMPAGWGQAWGNEPNPNWVWHWHDERKQFYYSAFGRGMPDLNLTNPLVVKQIEAVAKFWLQKGVDGFRLDAARYAIEEGPLRGQADTDATIDYWSSFAAYVKSVKPDALLIGEVWTNPKDVARYYNDGSGLGAAFDFDFGYHVKGLLNRKSSRSADFGTMLFSSHAYTRDGLWKQMVKRNEYSPFYFSAPFLTNHDQERLALELKNDQELIKIAASLLLTNPGAIFLYYGEEIGMSQYAVGDDQFRRSLMLWDESESAGFTSGENVWLNEASWFWWRKDQKAWWPSYWQSLRSNGASVAAQDQDLESVYRLYKKLLAIRQNHSQISSPDTLRYHPQKNKDVWLLEYLRGQSTAWVVINLNADQEAKLVVPEPLQGERFNQYTESLITIGAYHTLQPGEIMIFSQDNASPQ